MYLMTDKSKYKCGNCDTITQIENILKAPSPFSARDILWGCPNCKSAEDFERVCDADACEGTNVSGMPIGDEYKFLCRLHAPDLSNNNGTE